MKRRMPRQHGPITHMTQESKDDGCPPNAQLVLAVESSCDETAVAILRGRPGEPAEVLASEISSQIVLHREHGGVVPELASRNHLACLRSIVELALHHAKTDIRQIDAFAATTGPGLASSLLIGSTAAKGMALASGKPFIGVNHLEGHLLSPFVSHGCVPPHLGLIVSGGHTMLLEVGGPGIYRLIGSTRDDAAGEAFDKVGQMLDLPYPGGPEIEKAAATGNPAAFHFPRSMLHEPHLDFSFSGLKTAVLYTLQGLGASICVPDVAASFQQAVVDILVGKTICAAKQTQLRCISVSGGVSLNRALRDALSQACANHGIEFHHAPPQWCTDNAAMIAFAALLRHFHGESSPLDGGMNPNLSFSRA
jgi:N6-L-threonylcarbamoyladenine synthase